MLLTYCLSAVVAQARPTIKHKPPFLTVKGVGAKDVVLTAAALEKLPHRVYREPISADSDIEGSTYEGVPIDEVLKRAGFDFATNLQEHGLTQYLLVETATKNSVVFALPEFDPSFTDCLIMIAIKRNGEPLIGEEGPLRLIIPDEKQQVRWARQVRVLRIVDAVRAQH